MAGINSYSLITSCQLLGFCLVIVFVLLIATLNYNRRERLRTGYLLIGVYLCFICLVLSEFVWFLVDYYSPSSKTALYLLRIFYLNSASLASYFWFLYSEKESGNELLLKKWTILVSAIPCICEWILVYTTLKNGHVFWIGTNGEYYRGRLFNVIVVTNAVYYSIAMVRSLTRALKTRSSVARTLNFGLAVFPIPMLLASLVQLVSGYEFNCIGLTLSLGSLYVYVITGYNRRFQEMLEREKQAHEAEERRKNLIIGTLAGDFEGIIFIDIITDSVEIYQMKRATTPEILTVVSKGFEATAFYHAAHEIYGDDAERFRKLVCLDNLRRELATKDIFFVNYRMKTDEGLLYYQSKFVRDVTDPTGRRVILGERCIDNEMRRELTVQDRLERASNAKSEFLSRMSHDMRTPINGIMGMTSIARMNMNDSDRVSDCLRKIDTSSHHLLDLVNDVLDMTRIEKGKVTINHEPFNMDEFLANCVSIVEGQMHGRKLSFVHNFGPFKHPNLIGDELHLRQILINILGNSIKYTNDGGTIEMLISEGPETDGKVSFRFTVKDNGIGMKSEFIEHLFEPFSQGETGARSTYMGTGLGMPITASLIKLLDGTIEVESTYKVGSTFVVELPIEVDRGEAHVHDEAADNPLMNVNIAGTKVLVVEDNELNREIAKSLLEAAGVKVTTASDGREAIDVFVCARPGTFDLILMDIMMPNIDGHEATRIIRHLERPDAAVIPIIAMTANAFDMDVRKALEAGMDAHISKPVETEVLYRTVAKYTNRV